MSPPRIATFRATILLIVLGSLHRTVIGRDLPAGGDFGRWETHLRQCRIEARDVNARPVLPARPCLVLRLDQQGEGLLSVRFLDKEDVTTVAGPPIAFAGVLVPGQAGMRCRDGRCVPTSPLRLQVSALAVAGPGERSGGLPLAQLARGECLIVRRSVDCRARARDGVDWRARGHW